MARHPYSDSGGRGRTEAGETEAQRQSRGAGAGGLAQGLQLRQHCLLHAEHTAREKRDLL